MRVRSFCPSHIARHIAFVSLFFGFCFSASQASANQTSLDKLVQAVEDYLTAEFSKNISPAQSHIEISVNPLDPRLKLTQCDRPLSFTVRDTGSRGGNVSVHARCLGAQPWALYLPARIKILESVIVANRNIAKGATLTISDFDTQLLDTANLANNTVSDANRLLGKSTNRHIRAGESLRLSLVSEPIAIKRGDTMVVEAQTGAIVVSTRAIALADGRVGEQISARNTQSEKVIRVRVTGPGRGQVSF